MLFSIGRCDHCSTYWHLPTLPLWCVLLTTVVCDISLSSEAEERLLKVILGQCLGAASEVGGCGVEISKDNFLGKRSVPCDHECRGIRHFGPV